MRLVHSEWAHSDNFFATEYPTLLRPTEGAHLRSPHRIVACLKAAFYAGMQIIICSLHLASSLLGMSRRTALMPAVSGLSAADAL